MSPDLSVKIGLAMDQLEEIKVQLSPLVAKVDAVYNDVAVEMTRFRLFLETRHE